MSYQTFRFGREGDVGWLRLDRPQRLNSFTVQMWDEMREVGAAILDDASLRAMVVIGEGRAFSSGIDTSVFTDSAGNGARAGESTVDMVMRTQDAYTWLEEAPYPTIAAVHGYALGAGLQL